VVLRSMRGAREGAGWNLGFVIFFSFFFLLVEQEMGLRIGSGQFSPVLHFRHFKQFSCIFPQLF